jgi:hypothetical protein
MAGSHVDRGLKAQQQAVLTASQPSQLDFQCGLKGFSDYFTLTTDSHEEDTSEHEILSLYGRTNFKILLDAVRMSLCRLCMVLIPLSFRYKTIFQDFLRDAGTYTILII